MSQWQTLVAVLGVIAWWITPPSSLGDLALREHVRRQTTSSSARMLTDRDVAALPSRSVPSASPRSYVDAEPDEPGPAPKSAVSPDPRGDASSAGPNDEAWWRARITGARAAFDRDQLLADALQTRINALTNDVASRDDPGQRAVLIEQRLRVVTELNRLKTALDADRRAIDDIIEAARKQGVPAGWLRGV